ncbi:DNA-protecting protein DprA [Allokutzneria sp. A3M-2-11 16]|uniref:DNA-processing protein DprA n=1 Tax=Allokutzneria sp. A3M-2-11 16 TaxID=2962043 RepID=UPI0020B67A08|nr:DNA-processing protein DprA [Allokutzneria sp. A3M-2-11 16]MCP3799116.1 DNA-protecting protein DprA [Allokutzneria sp. A3M-2-11 16]
MGRWGDDEKAALVALLRTRPAGMSWPEITAEVADAGSALKIWEAHLEPSLFTAPDEDLRSARADVESWNEEDFEFLTFYDDHYPAQLREVHQMPPVLFTRGNLVADDKAVSVVGPRHASNEALANAAAISTGLARTGLTVLSGLAEGVDTTAHVSALACGGRTVAIIGTGIQKSYPAANRALQEKISQAGLVISQFWPDAPPSKQSFPMRNATMSAYGRATIVVEASEKSGTRIQARVAVAHGRPVILMDSVARGTEWGNALVGEPGVFTARTPDEAVERAEDLANRLGDISHLLDAADDL